MNIEYTCIKEKAKGVYKNTSSSVATEEKLEETTISSLDFETDIENFNLESWIKVVRSKYQNLHVIKEKSVNDKYLIWHCAKSQVDKETQFILGITPIHIYCYPNLTFCDSFTGRFNNSQEFFDKQKQSDTVDLIEISENEKTFSSEEIEKIKIYFDYPLDRNDDEEDRDSSELNQDTSEHLEEPMTDKDWHIVRNTWFEADNPDVTIIESHFNRDLDILIVFGVPPFGDVKDNYCIWKYTNCCTDLIFVGRKEALYQRYKKYCDELKNDDKNTSFVTPTNEHLREYIDRLEKDGRYFPKKQLSFFGEEK